MHAPDPHSADPHSLPHLSTHPLAANPPTAGAGGASTQTVAYRPWTADVQALVRLVLLTPSCDFGTIV